MFKPSVLSIDTVAMHFGVGQLSEDQSVLLLLQKCKQHS